MPQQTEDLSCLSYWYPRVVQTGIPTPPTQIVKTDADLTQLLDGVTPDGYDEFAEAMRVAILSIGVPCFIRTGHGSGKHEWGRTCYFDGTYDPQEHIFRLVEWSHVVEIGGLPLDVWAVREMIQTAPLFTAFEGMPITVEYRLFAKDGKVTHIQPYWPLDSIVNPSDENWQELLEDGQQISAVEVGWLTKMAAAASEVVDTDTEWSIDFLKSARGTWWLTDMAEAELSFRYNP